MPPHGRAGHTVQALTNSLVGRMHDSFTMVPANDRGLMETDQCLKHAQITVGQAEGDTGSGEFAKYFPFVDAGRGEVQC